MQAAGMDVEPDHKPVADPLDAGQQQQEQQQPQQQVQHQPGSKQHSRRAPLPSDANEGPNEEKWWLSESEGEGSEGGDTLPAVSEDPLYDPEADAADEAWAVQQRSGRTTDAILSCPSCFTTLCIDCQQHEHYHTQYRAMFTQNCEVKLDQTMQAQVQRQPQQRRGKRRAPDSASEHGQGDQPQQLQQQQQQQGEEGTVREALHLVCCAVCGEQVGAQDADEVVHFFHVLASEC